MLSSLDKLINSLQEQYPDGVVVDMRKGNGFMDVERIPLDSPKIESLFGLGGLPRGRIIEVYGPESGGKTSFCEYIAGQIQKSDLPYPDSKTGETKTRKGFVVYIDAEHAIAPDFAQVHGFNLSNAVLVQPDSGEQACDIAIKFAQSGEVDLIVIDSIAAMTPQSEIDADMDQMSMGLQARMLSKFFRKCTAILAKTNTTMLCINQIRSNIGTYGNPETTCVVPSTFIKFADNPFEAEKLSEDDAIGWRTFEDMFKSQGVDWSSLPEESSISTSGNLWTLSQDSEGKLIPKKVTKLVRKQDSYTIALSYYDESGKVVFGFEGTPAHRIWARVPEGSYQWYTLKEVSKLKKVFIATSKGEREVALACPSLCKRPIVDLEVEDTHVYFANGVLSHNTGGNALKFYSSVRLEMRKREYIMEKETPIGIVINAKSVKNKTAPPMVKQQLEMYFDRSFDASMEWVDFAIEYQVITTAGAGFFTLPGEIKIRGRQNVIAFLKDPENQAIYDKIIAMTKERMYLKTKGKTARVSVDDPEEEKLLEEELND